MGVLLASILDMHDEAHQHQPVQWETCGFADQRVASIALVFKRDKNKEIKKHSPQSLGPVMGIVATLIGASPEHLGTCRARGSSRAAGTSVPGSAGPKVCRQGIRWQPVF